MADKMAEMLDLIKIIKSQISDLKENLLILQNIDKDTDINTYKKARNNIKSFIYDNEDPIKKLYGIIWSMYTKKKPKKAITITIDIENLKKEIKNIEISLLSGIRSIIQKNEKNYNEMQINRIMPNEDDVFIDEVKYGNDSLTDYVSPLTFYIEEQVNTLDRILYVLNLLIDEKERLENNQTTLAGGKRTRRKKSKSKKRNTKKYKKLNKRKTRKYRK